MTAHRARNALERFSGALPGVWQRVDLVDSDSALAFPPYFPPYDGLDY